MFDFEAIAKIVPEKGWVTFSFSRKRPGVLLMIYAPMYSDVGEKTRIIANRPKPFTGTPVELSITAATEITQIAEETRKFIVAASQHAQKNKLSRGEEIRVAREKLETNIADNTESHAPSASEPPSSAGEQPRNNRKGRQVHLTEEDIAKISRLPEPHRYILQMRFVEGKTLQEIGDLLGGISKQAVSLKQSLAIKRLRNL